MLVHFRLAVLCSKSSLTREAQGKVLKKDITYKDLEDNEVTETFYFNLSKAELAELELKYKGGFGGFLRTVIEAQDANAIIGTFKAILSMSVGRKADDNRRFIKDPDTISAFMDSGAYDVVFMELLSSEEAAAQFINAIVPDGMAAEIVAAVEPPKGKKFEDYTAQELLNMDTELFTNLIGTSNPKRMTREQLEVSFARKLAGME